MEYSHGVEDQQKNKRFPDGFRIMQGMHEYVTYTEHSSIRIWESETATHFDMHQHSAVELIMPLEGISLYRTEEKEYKVRAGQILLIPPEVRHELTETPGTRRYLMLFEPTPLMSLRDQPSFSLVLQAPIHLAEESELRTKIVGLLMQMIAVYFEQEPMWNARCYAYLLQLYAALGSQAVYARAAGEPVHMDSEILNSAMTYINQHYMEDICLEDVASFTGFSRFYFSRVFRQFAGCSFSEFLTRKRITAATDLLVRTDIPVQDVAVQAGFGSVATFNRVFRRQNQCTPTQYRAIYGKSMVPEAARWIFSEERDAASPAPRSEKSDMKEAGILMTDGERINPDCSSGNGSSTDDSLRPPRRPQDDRRVHRRHTPEKQK